MNRTFPYLARCQNISLHKQTFLLKTSHTKHNNLSNKQDKVWRKKT